MIFTLDVLNERHVTENFDCGVQTLDTWLKEYAFMAQNNMTARVFVFRDDQYNVVGYFSLTSHVVSKKILKGKLRHGSPKDVPSVLLGKLALNKNLHGHGFGKDLLHAAMKCAYEGTNFVAARILIVDALNENVVSFYKQFGFTECLGSEYRLGRKFRDIERDLRT